MRQAIALAAVQDAIAAQYPDESIELIAQVHYIRPDDVAHVDVYGCDDVVTRRSIRMEAERLLLKLGFRVELVGNHDMFTVSADFFDTGAVLSYREILTQRPRMKLADLHAEEQAYIRDCSRTGAYVNLQRLSAHLRERVDAQALRQRPVVDSREHYYVSDVMAEFED